MASIFDWSTIPGNNANADSGINWAEGQAPSTVNNSARVMMGRLAEFLGDIGGALTAGGTANFLTVTANSAFTTLDNGRIVAFRATSDNSGSATLNVNTTGAKSIRKMDAAGADIPLEAGDIRTGGIYVVRYSTAGNGGVGAWILDWAPKISMLDRVPVGSGMDFWGTVAPDGYIFPLGQALSRTTYADLFAVMGTTYGAGDGSTTFNVPDKRGRTSFGKDNMGGVSADRLTGQSGGIDGDTLGDTGGAETHTLTESQLAAHDHGNGSLTAASAGNHSHNVSLGNVSAASGGGHAVDETSGINEPTSTAGAHTHSITGSTGSTGSGEAFNILPPGIVCSYIIFTGVVE